VNHAASLDAIEFFNSLLVRLYEPEDFGGLRERADADAIKVPDETKDA
jgi:hypothetical protein